MARIGPVIFEAAGDSYVNTSRIGGIVWEGSTASGNLAELQCRETKAVLWAGRANDTQTYLGAVDFGGFGIHCPHGFKATKLDNGRLLIYLREQ